MYTWTEAGTFAGVAHWTFVGGRWYWTSWNTSANPVIVTWWRNSLGS